MKEYEDEIYISALNAYLSEIARHPLLTLEEEKKYGKDLKLVYDLKIVDINDDEEANIYSLDLNKIYLSCINNNEYKTIISTLMSYYVNKNEKDEKEVYDSLKKYKRLSEKLDRSLSIDELKEKFNISNEDIEILDTKELLEQTRDFITYKNAFDKMFNSNLRLVVSMAKRYNILTSINTTSLELLDLINEGNIGLIKAIQRYDIDKDTKFSTYATYWIKQSILRYIANTKGHIRIPVHLDSEILAFKRKVSILQREKGYYLNDEQIAKELNIPIEKVIEYQNNMHTVVSLDQPIDTDDDTSLGDMIFDEENIGTEDMVIKSSLNVEMNKLISTLSDREQLVIRKRFGFDDNKIERLDEVGKRLGVTRERVRQIEARAIKRLKYATKSNNNNNGSLKDYIK